MATKLATKYQQVVDAVKRPEITVLKKTVDALKLIDSIDLEDKTGSAAAAERMKSEGIKAAEKGVAALQAASAHAAEERIKLKPTITDSKVWDQIKVKIDALLAEINKLIAEVKKFSQMAKGFEVEEKDVKFKPIASAFAAKYKAACQKAKQKADEPLVKALTDIDTYDEPVELVALTKTAKGLIDKEVAEIAKVKAKADHAAKGLLNDLESYLKKLREEIKKKDSLNFFANKGLF